MSIKVQLSPSLTKVYDPGVTSDWPGQSAAAAKTIELAVASRITPGENVAPFSGLLHNIPDAATAIRHVHGEKGPWTTQGGWEYNAVLIGAVLAIVEDEWGPGWALASGLAGVAGSFAVSKLGEHEAAGEFEPVPFEAGEPVREPVQG